MQVGRWPGGYGSTYVEAVGAPAGERDDHHYVEDFGDPGSNHHPVAEVPRLPAPASYCV